MEHIDAIRSELPEHSKDIKLNLQSVLTQSKLTPDRTWGVALASAITARSERLTDACEQDALAAGVSEDVLDDARAAASLMAMNNVFYRFKHYMGSADYDGMPARLRMNRIARPKGSKVDFELFCLAVSAINGCEMCVKSHEKVVRAGDISMDEVHDSVRIASTINAAACALWQA